MTYETALTSPHKLCVEVCKMGLAQNANGKLVVYLGPFSFPHGGAASRRILGNCQSLVAAGFRVIVASGQTNSSESDGRLGDISVASLGERSAEHLPRWLKHLAYIKMGAKSVDWLDSLPEKPFAVILYSGYTPYLLRLRSWAKKREVNLVFDAVEWYEPKSLLGYLSPYQMNVEFAMRKLIPWTANVISIGSYLHQYYCRKGCKSIVIPPTTDVVNLPYSAVARSNGSTLKLVYAGYPAANSGGMKDELDVVIQSVLELADSGLDVNLTIAGVAESDSYRFSSLKGRHRSSIGAVVKFMGNLPHSSVLNLVMSSDYSVLIRNQSKVANAGFPTKFVESFSLGTPVIANLTSDIGLYLLDQETGFHVTSVDVLSTKQAIERAFHLNESQHGKMRENCRNVALKSFDFRSYIEVFSGYMLSI